MKHIIPWVLILASCSTPATNDKGDSTAFREDTIVLDEDQAQYLEVTGSLDTTITETLDIQSAFNSSQIKPTVAYVYYEEGANVYEKNMWPSAPDALVIGGVDFRGKVNLVEPLINNAPSDTMTISGLKGRMIAINYDGKTGFVFSGFLLNLPVPEEGLQPMDYFSHTLHLVQPVVNKRHECDDCEDISSETTYEYEQGITVTDNSYYETYNRSVYFGNNFTLQEAFLFARHFYSFLRNDFTEFPAEPVEEEIEEGRSKQSVWQNGNITHIISVTGEGCYEEEGVHVEDGRVKMSANGGC